MVPRRGQLARTHNEEILFITLFKEIKMLQWSIFSGENYVQIRIER